MAPGGTTSLEGIARGIERDGHVVVRAALTGEVLARALLAAGAEVDRILADSSAPATPHQQHGWHQDDYVGLLGLVGRTDALGEIVRSPTLARLAAAALGVPRVRLLYDQLFAKPAGARCTVWHQDEGYWPVDTTDVVEASAVGTVRVWLTLTALPAAVGGLRFVDGSHRCGAIDPSELRSRAPGRTEVVGIDGHDLPVSDYGALEAGDATLHAGYTLHGARGNPSRRIRYAVTMAYVPDGARVAEPADPLQAVAISLHTPGKRPGDLIDGPDNPVLWSSDDA